MTHAEIQAFLAETYGWSYDTIDGMSFEQINNAVSKGKKPKGIPINTNADAEEINRNWRQYVGI